MLIRFLLLFFSISLLCHCNPNPASTASQTPATTQPAADNTQGKSYPSIPIERLQYLWDNASYMDVVFYELPISMNQSSLASIRTTLAHIAEVTPTISPNCKSIGRIFFQVGPKNVETAEIYFQPGCTCYLWLENDKPVYANNMTEEGVAFYNNIFKSVQEQGQQPQQ